MFNALCIACNQPSASFRLDESCNHISSTLYAMIKMFGSINYFLGAQTAVYGWRCNYKHFLALQSAGAPVLSTAIQAGTVFAAGATTVLSKSRFFLIFTSRNKDLLYACS